MDVISTLLVIAFLFMTNGAALINEYKLKNSEVIEKGSGEFIPDEFILDYSMYDSILGPLEGAHAVIEWNEITNDFEIKLYTIDGIPKYDYLYDSILGPSEGFYVVTEWNETTNDFEKQFYTIDGTATGWIFDTAWEFHDGWAMVSKGGEDFLIDINGNLFSISPYEFAWGDGFHEDRLLVKENGLYGYLDSSLQLVIPCIYQDAYTWFVDGRVKVQTIEGEWYIIDKYGMILEAIQSP